LGVLVAFLGGPAVRTFTATFLASFEEIVVASVALVFAARSPMVLSATLTAVVVVLGRMDRAFELLLGPR
jgi:hypothetical protein